MENRLRATLEKDDPNASFKVGKPTGWDMHRLLAEIRRIGYDPAVMNIIQWCSYWGALPREMMFRSHYVIIDGVLCKQRYTVDPLLTDEAI